ncbi:MAG: NPCBM/NEW2 domain-containing protein, partial [Verrucomicrobiota bacterium]
HRAIKWYGLDKNIHNGRIYRVRHKDFDLSEMPRMLDQTPAELVEHLSHPNGWWRDEAQKLIVISGDQSLIPALKEKLANDESDYGSLHALWTIEGLGGIDMALLETAFTNNDANVRAAAVRLSEPYFQNDLAVLAKLEPLVEDESNDVLLQILLSMSTKVTPETRALAEKVLAAHTSNTYLAEVDQELNKAWFEEQAEQQALAALAAEERELMTAGKAHYAALCVSCHGTDGKGSPNPAEAGTTMAPSFVGSPRVIGAKNTLTRIALDGLTGPLDGKSYPGGIMVPLKMNNDHYIASVLTYIRNSFGNKAEMITEGEVASVRRDTLGRNSPYTQNELNQIMLNADCPPNRWKVTTTHRPDDAIMITDDDEKTVWMSHAEQKTDMWLDIEFPHPRNLDYILLDANHGTDFPVKYAIEFSENGTDWNHKIEVDGEKKTEIDFERRVASRVRIGIAEPNPKWWRVSQLEISGPSESDVNKYEPERREYLKVSDAASFKQGWSDPKQDKSVMGRQLSIADEKYDHGIGTHSDSEFIFSLEGKNYERFFTNCGADDGEGRCTVTFEVHLDGQKVFDSGQMKHGDPAKYVDVNIVGKKELKLVVTSGADGETAGDHCNWVNTCFIK